jgi:beta-barrel assembly-enhancing protease
MKRGALTLAALLTATPAFAQLGGILNKAGKAMDAADKVKALSEKDERAAGEEVSTLVRKEFGVFQDAAVTKYVTLVGTVLAQASSRPDLKWEFIVLDTDGVNAFAAPGGIVHITRGALGLIKSESELAGVLGHEVAHVMKRHTAKAIQKSNTIKLATDLVPGSADYIRELGEAFYEDIVENKYDRDDENDADQEGVRLANKAGYNPSGLGTFLTKLMERNKGETERNGLFASHPETRDRIAKLDKQITSEKLKAPAIVAARYASTITFDAKPLAQVTTVAAGTKGVAGGSAKPAEGEKKEEKKEEPKRKGFGLGSLGLTKGKQQESTQASASGGGRAVGSPDRHATGGDNSTKVSVSITPADVAEFKKGIA